MGEELSPQHPGDGLLGEVVVGGPQPPGGDDKIRPGQSQFHRLLKALGVIPHHPLVVEVQPHLRQPTGDGGGVGVDGVAHQQFGANAENLGGLGFLVHKSPPISCGFFFICRYP